VQEAEWARGPVWTGAENYSPTGILSPDRPGRSEPGRKLSWPGPRSYLCIRLERIKNHKTANEDGRCPQLRLELDIFRMSVSRAAACAEVSVYRARSLFFVTVSTLDARAAG
jgi:hypothetical protein